MTALVFAGPTLPADAVVARLPGAVVLPPARQGDIFRAVRTHRPLAVGLIDGVFLHEPAVWHREILWALSEGVHVFGAASMGALRAAELFPFGMRGVGRVFSAYRDGLWPGFADAFEDDDEVAVVHAPAELGAVSLSDALVDLRDTLLAAEAAGLLMREERDALFAALKALPFPERSFRTLADVADAQWPGDRAERLRGWLPGGQVARKRLDAEAMLSELAAFLQEDPPPFAPGFRFEPVQVWADFVRTETAVPGAEDALVLEEVRLRPDEWQEAARAALGRLYARAAMAPLPDAAIRHAFDAFRIAQGLGRRADIDTWLADNELPPTGLAQVLQDEAALAAVLADPPAALATALADQLRLAGRFAPLLRRARAKRAVLADMPLPPPGPALDSALVWWAERHAPQGGGAAGGSASETDFHLSVWREYVFINRGCT